MSNILFLVEGYDEQAEIEKGILNIVNIADSDISIKVYSTSIYELYSYMKNDPYFDIVSHLNKKGIIEINENDISKTAFSEIYLMFDFEPHYQKYSDEAIIELINFFDNETEHGKLYINYPMFESLYDMKSPDDKDYLCSTVSLDGFTGKCYKKTVYDNSFCHHNPEVKKHIIFKLVKQNYLKVLKIINKELDIDNYHKILLNKQIELKNSERKIFIVNTLSLFPIDYNNDLLNKFNKNK